MKKGFVKKIFEALTKESAMSAQPKKNDDKPQFEIPSAEVLEAMENSKQLTYAQILEVMRYIKFNYHLVSDGDALYNFSFNWLRCAGDIEEINEYKQAAIENIVTNLRSGAPIDDLDALWVSDKIYVDVNNDVKRIIEKEVVDGSVTLKVVKDSQDKRVVKEIEQLRKEWCKAKNNTHDSINVQVR